MKKKTCITPQFIGLLLGLLIGLSCFQARAQRRGTTLSLTPTTENVFLTVRIPRYRYRRINQRGWKVATRLWIRRSSGWVRVGRRELSRRQWTRAIPTSRVCRGSHGKVKLVLQLGVRNRRLWWNRWTRKWQNSFIAARQTIAHVQCASIPDDMPPGSPTGIGTIAAQTPPQEDPYPPSAPPAQPAPSNPAPGQPEPGQPEPGQPEPGQPEPGQHVPADQPPPPPVVPSQTFLSFYQSMKDASFDNGRYKMLRSWLSRLNQHRLRPGQIVRLLKTFSFDSTRTKAAIKMSRYVLRPLKVRQVIRIISPFSFSSHKLKAAMYYCRGLEDALNVHLLAKEFSFSSSKRKIMRRCR